MSENHDGYYGECRGALGATGTKKNEVYRVRPFMQTLPKQHCVSLQSYTNRLEDELEGRVLHTSEMATGSGRQGKQRWRGKGDE